MLWILSSESIIQRGWDKVLKFGLLLSVVVIIREKLLVLWEAEIGGKSVFFAKASFGSTSEVSHENLLL